MAPQAGRQVYEARCESAMWHSEFCAELWHPDPSYSCPPGLPSFLYFRCLFMFVIPLI